MTKVSFQAFLGDVSGAASVNMCVTICGTICVSQCCMHEGRRITWNLYVLLSGFIQVFGIRALPNEPPSTAISSEFQLFPEEMLDYC